MSALDRAVSWLADCQHPVGTWSDFLTSAGTSVDWVTAYTGTALASAARDPRVGRQAAPVAVASARRAAAWLVPRMGTDGGWGWSSARTGVAVRPDADSTAWTVRLLAACDSEVPARSVTFLTAHATNEGYRTYRSEQASGAWAAPTPDVTAAVLLALHAAGELDSAALAERWTELLASGRTGGGPPWRSLWWEAGSYPAAIVAEAWAAAGGPAFPRRRHTLGDVLSGTGGTAWEAATALWAAARFGAPGARLRPVVTRLLALQRGDGGWGGSAALVAPSPRPTQREEHTQDARGIFTTATAVFALLAAPGVDIPTPPIRGQRLAETPVHAVVASVADASGVQRDLALSAFRALTRESLRDPELWPAQQLSSLAGGAPVEFSVGASPALRLTTEVGDPLAPPARRLTSGLEDVRRAATALGMADSLRRASPALSVLADPNLDVPDGCQFWLWAGLDLTARSSVLKAYVSLHADSVPGWKEREREFLRRCGIGDDAPVHAILSTLKESGWCQEAGIGLAPGGCWGVKVYYEFAGYRPVVVREVLARSGLDPDPSQLAPEVPGVLRAGLAAKSRAGVAVRIQPADGTVSEVTSAAVFPVPLAGRDVVTSRIQDWLDGLGEGAPHARTVAVLAPGWADAPPAIRMHSLLTRSRRRTRSGGSQDETKVYVRPWLGRGGPSHSPAMDR